MKAIDVHAHVIVPELLREAAPDETWRPADTSENGRPIVELGGRTIRSMRDGVVLAEEILATEQQREIDHVLLSPWVPLLFYDVDPDEGLRRARLQNHGLARLHRESAGRIDVLGAVPLQDPRLAASELIEIMSSGEFAGVEVTASVAGSYLGDARFDPFWEAAETCGAIVFVHPTTRGFALPVLDEYYLRNLVGNPLETTVAAAHIVMAGVFERYPRLRILLAHGGGTVVALRGRLRRGQEAVPAARTGSTLPADELVGRFLFDTVTHDPTTLRALVSLVGADRVLLGSDYPFDMADPRPVQTVGAAGLTREEEEAILCGNAAEALGLDRAVRS
jgi:aminocarboxymuconate-semialdehyde decarboxylase